MLKLTSCRKKESPKEDIKPNRTLLVLPTTQKAERKTTRKVCVAKKWPKKFMLSPNMRFKHVAHKLVDPLLKMSRFPPEYPYGDRDPPRMPDVPGRQSNVAEEPVPKQQSSVAEVPKRQSNVAEEPRPKQQRRAFSRKQSRDGRQHPRILG